MSISASIASRSEGEEWLEVEQLNDPGRDANGVLRLDGFLLSMFLKATLMNGRVKVSGGQRVACG